MKSRIESVIPGARAQVETDGHHYEAIVVSEVFRGVPTLKQHRMVYAALREELRGEVHALALKTYTPEAWAAESQ